MRKPQPAKSRHTGKACYLCASACKNAFGGNSAKYIGGEGLDIADLSPTDEAVRNIR